ncbi:protein FAR1-RELATED SEQUENCE 1-like [Spinacia oleracea]|uniref:Protein FAR1-RELATED SEQUENCE 1-like n=1 Tax=Spinacia oleracea TaxID=3562 RepID=A0ABM3RR28_SPIOL|nr:protein FAR1-RELATED SEQUENCE 1-like [Spinacia oleracea]
MCHEAGGEEAVGHSIKDHLNFVTRKKMKEIEGGDVQNVIDNLYNLQSGDPDVFFRFRLKENGKLETPVSVFTDQDQAMSNAIMKIMPLASHTNVVSRFGALKRDTTFKDAFNHCLSGCVSEEEFERCWEKMITTYNLGNSKWFKRLYKIKDKWCTGLSKDFFSSRILSSQ